MLIPGFENHHLLIRILTTVILRYYAKRCFLGLSENLAKHMTVFEDDLYKEIMIFLDAAEVFSSIRFSE